MDLLSPSPTTNSTLTPVLGDNVQDLFGSYPLQVHPSSIITVNSVDDAVPSIPGVITLRDAINQANSDTGEDLIVFDRSLFSNAQTITLNLGELDITHNLDIIAPRDSLTGGDLVTVSGNKTSRVFEVETGATVNFNGLIVADGIVKDDNGGGIKNSGTLTLDNSIVRDNGSRSNGGGIYNDGGIIEVNNSTISGNFAPFSGGGVDNKAGIVNVSNSTISGNTAGIGSGGGICGIVNVSNSTISGNRARSGGGIEGTGNVSNSTISGNGARYGGGGISGIFNVSNSTLVGNSTLGRGGGIEGGGNVSNSTINGNRAVTGGGIYNDSNSKLTVTNSTISDNSAFNVGGGIYNDYSGTLMLLFSTVTQNQAVNGSGVYQSNVPSFNSPLPGSASVRNTIIASNLNSENGVNSDVSGNFTSNGYNLIGSSTGSTGFDEAIGDIVGTSDNPIDPRLAPLNFNGGSTQTLALLPDSPAIDAGDPTILDTDPTTDQRGFPRVSNGRTDIGAFEFS